MQAQLLTTEIPSDVTGWWASEKYDGVRAIWTGSKLVTRHGKNLNPPAWFIAGLPADVRLDGELWMGRGTFDALRSTIQHKGSDWRGVYFMVFDLADIGTFEDRNSDLVFLPLPAHFKKITHHELTGHDQLDAMETNIVNAGGEGVVIRRPGSEYRPGRSGDIIKVKRLVADLDRWQG
jgi:DNA ligase-1